MSTTKVPNTFVTPPPSASEVQTALDNKVSLDTEQTITGSKTFSSDLNLKPATNSSNTGGTINFHYNQNSNTTSSIVENASGQIRVNGDLELDGDFKIVGNNAYFTNKNVYIRSEFTKGTASSSNAIENAWGVVDCNNKLAGRVNITNRYISSNDFKNEVRLVVYDPTDPSSGALSSIAIVDTQNGVYTIAPTPATSDNSTKIATTEWVRSATGSIAATAAKANRLASSNIDTINIDTESNGRGSYVTGISTNVAGNALGVNRPIDMWLNILSIDCTHFCSQFVTTVASTETYNPIMYFRSKWSNSSNFSPWQEVSSIVEKSIGSSGYIRYKSGLQMCWGNVNIADSSTGTSVTFTKAFNAEPKIFLNTAWANGYGYSYGLQAISRSSTGFTAVCGSGTATTSTTRWSSGNASYFAIGLWG